VSSGASRPKRAAGRGRSTPNASYSEWHHTDPAGRTASARSLNRPEICATSCIIAAKGIDPNVRLNPSGVAWLGSVPSHWQVRRFKEVLQEVDDRSEEGSEELLSVSHLTGVTPRSSKTVYMFEAETNEGYKRCKPGDLVVNTMWAWMGALGVSPCSGIVSPSYNVYRPRSADLFDPRFLDLLCRVPPLVAFIKSVSTGVWTSRLRLHPETLFDIFYVAPSVPEQRAIVAMLEKEVSLARSTSAAATATIALLEEYRSALTTATITGKIDVRATPVSSALVEPLEGTQ
jgi:type I restriction enzyme, S subunit